MARPAALTAARPKTASYPFTTINPVIGVLESGDPDGLRVQLADIPGLIEGAHSNKGLGHKFLRHIERCPVLVHLAVGAALLGVFCSAHADDKKPNIILIVSDDTGFADLGP